MGNLSNPFSRQTRGYIAPLPPHARILVVDSNSADQAVAMLQLNLLGIATQVANTRQEALAALTRTSFCLVLLECRGMESLAIIRTIKAFKEHLPIVAVAARLDDEDRIAYLRAGASECLRKPFAPEKLRELLSRRIGVNGVRD
jgi:CheY-like chemotaxis protein